MVFQPSPDLIIGADTIVTNGKSIFEKPSSKDHAIEMITRYVDKNYNKTKIYLPEIIYCIKVLGEGRINNNFLD